MPKPLSADDILPLVARLTPQERRRLVRLISAQPGTDDSDGYRGQPPAPLEFSQHDEPLAWDAEGWEDVG